MAKITIELDTDSPDDAALMVGFGAAINSMGLGSHYRPAHNEARHPETDEPEPYMEVKEQLAVGEQVAQRKRRTKAQIEADNAAASSATPASSALAPQDSGPDNGPTAPTSASPSEATPTLAEINAMLRKLVNEHKQPVLALQEVIKEATGGKHISQTEPGAEAFYGDIMAGLKALEEKATAHG